MFTIRARDAGWGADLNRSTGAAVPSEGEGPLGGQVRPPLPWASYPGLGYAPYQWFLFIAGGSTMMLHSPRGLGTHLLGAHSFNSPGPDGTTVSAF